MLNQLHYLNYLAKSIVQGALHSHGNDSGKACGEHRKGERRCGLLSTLEWLQLGKQELQISEIERMSRDQLQKLRLELEVSASIPFL